ncbi:MAG: acyl-CoA thioesterase [Alcanivoracaceae bacterium]|nr:acyl-CoA thioesterase [Alcanivoracaceae bacterium]
MSERKAIGSRADYKYFVPITTRWHDNDLYGHVNNVTYYSYFDSVANHYLIHVGKLDIHHGQVIGLVVNSGCSYHAPLEFPDELEGGLRINRLGNSSVEYGIAIFRKGEASPAAEGHFVHVFVDRQSRRPTAMPAPVRDAFSQILVES